jgi:PAS domain S-box-containing protein
MIEASHTAASGGKLDERRPRLHAAVAARLLQEAALRLGDTLEPERVYDHFHELLADVIPHDGLVVSSYDERDDMIRADYVWVAGKKFDPSTLPPVGLNREGEGMQSQVIMSGKGKLINDVADRIEQSKGTFYSVDAEGDVRKVPETGDAGVRAALMAPIKHEGRVVGVVQVMSDQIPYTHEQLDLVEGIVAQMSAAARNARLYEAAQKELQARAEVERALRESEARFRVIFENAAAGMAEVGLDGRWLRVNDQLCEITGYSREQLLQLRFHDITHPDDRSIDEGQRERMAAGLSDRYARKKRYLHKDGREVVVALTASLVRDEEGAPNRFVAIVEDITDREHAEAERRRLAAAEEAARAIAREREQEARVLAAVGDGIALVDDEGIVRVWNPAAEEITGLLASRVIGDRLAKALPALAAVMTRVDPEQASQSETVPVEIADREIWLSIVAVRTTDGVVYAFRDLTAQHRLDEAKSELVATVSHELRTPLTAVHGAAKTLLHRERELSAAQRVELLAMLETQTERLKHLADEFLVASRLEAGELPVATVPVDAVALARETIEAMRGRVRGGIDLQLGRSEIPAVRGDRDKLRQVLLNLLDNAIKYSPNGMTLVVSIRKRRGRIRIAVRDRGLGIPRSERERVFEKFYRVDPDLARAPGGTGLGLYISRELVHRMGGEIGVQSTEGRGSTFYVDLRPA